MHIGERCNPGVTEVAVAAQLQGLQGLVLCKLYEGCICHRSASKRPQLLKSPQLNNYVHCAVLQVQKGLLSEWPQNQSHMNRVLGASYHQSRTLLSSLHHTLKVSSYTR